MIILTNTGSGSDTLTLQAITASSVLMCHASYVDNAGGSVFTPGRTNTIYSAAGTQTVVPAPTTGSYRTVKTLTIYNSSSTVACQLQLNHVTTIAGQQNVALLTITLPPGYCCQYNEGMGFVTIGADGQNRITIQKGRLLKTSILTYPGAAATISPFTCGPNTNTLKIRGCGAGGGGGPTTSVAAAAGAGAGGGAGGYLEWVVAVTPNLQCTYTVGVGGGSGASGTASTFVVSGVTATASFGLLGSTGTGTTTVTAHAGGACNAQSTNGTLNGKGAPGGYGIVPLVGAGTTEIVASGRGGSSAWGLAGGGVGVATPAVGNAGTGYGSGGSGAACGASTLNAGGAGTNGVWIVEEYS